MMPFDFAQGKNGLSIEIPSNTQRIVLYLRKFLKLFIESRSHAPAWERGNSFLLKLMKVLYTFSYLVFSLAASFSALAGEAVSIKHQGLKLNATYKASQDKSQAFFVLLHGTLAHNKMEIISSVQAGIEERWDGGYLAINLSYGFSDRDSAFLACEVEHRHRFEDGAEELAAWIDFLQEQGYSNLVLLGHSRGGAQVALYASQNPATAIAQIYLLAPASLVASEEQQAKNAKMLAKAKDSEKPYSGDFLYCEDTTATGQAIKSYYGSAYERSLVELIDSHTTPVHVFLGSEDKVVADVPGILASASFKKNPPEITSIDGADHFFLDFYMEEIFDILEEAL